MKILIVLDSYPPDLNGGAYFTHRLALSLQKRGHDVLVLCPSRSLKQGYGYYEGVKLYQVRSWPAPGYVHFRVSWPLGITKSVVRAIESFDPDIIHLQGKFFLGKICHRAGLKLGIRMIATNHFMPENFFHYTHLPKWCAPKFAEYCWRWVLEMLQEVDIVTTPTATAKKLLREVGFEKPVEVISCGVDLDIFKPNQDASILKKRFNIPEKPVLLYTGRLDREKNLLIALEAFRQLRETHDVHFVLTGRGAEALLLQKWVRDHHLAEHVTFTGYLEDHEYPLIYGLADCFVHTGLAELQSIVGLEAIASGLPMIAARAMALPELVTPGVNGYLFEPRSVSELTQALCEIFSDDTQRLSMGKMSRTLARRHALEETAKSYEELYF